ncbi:MAG: topoisomerase DNA-binding C4 zinc finger domain-containing protein [Patescibacteria group bacterium]
MTEAYCVKCKAKKEMKDAKEVAMNGKGGVERRAMTGICPSCGTKMVWRKSERGDFWGCGNYPRCRQVFHVAAIA